MAEPDVPNNSASTSRAESLVTMHGAHSRIVAIAFLYLALAFLLIGGIVAVAAFWEVAWPNDPARPNLFARFLGVADWSSIPRINFVSADSLAILVRTHAALLVSSGLVAGLLGGIGCIVLPGQISARKICGRWLAWIAFVAFGIGGLCTLAPLWMGQADDAVRTHTMGTLTNALASFLLALTFVLTFLRGRVPGMKARRIPLASWGIIWASLLALVSSPIEFVVTLRALMAGGSNDAASALTTSTGVQSLAALTPAIIISITIVFGCVFDILAALVRRAVPLSGTMILMLGLYALLGGCAWTFDVFVPQSESAAATMARFALYLTSIPVLFMLLSWTTMLAAGRARANPAFYFAIAAILLTIVSGVSGSAMAFVENREALQQSMYRVAHIHMVLIGTGLFGFFACVYFWFPALRERQLNQSLGRMHFWLTAISCVIAFGLLMWQGLNHDDTDVRTQTPLLSASGIFMLMLLAAQWPFAVNVCASIFKFGNRAAIYFGIIILLEWLAGWLPVIDHGPIGFLRLSPSVHWIAALVFSVLIIAFMVLIDIWLRRTFPSKRKNPRPNRWVALWTWASLFPLFLYPMLASGALADWLGIGVSEYAMPGWHRQRMPFVPQPAEVDLDLAEPMTSLVMRDKAAGEREATIPAVSAVYVDLDALEANSQGSDFESELVNLNLRSNAITDPRSGRVVAAFDVSAIVQLENDELAQRMTASLIQVPYSTAITMRVNAQSGARVHRTWFNGEQDRTWHMLVFEWPTLGSIVTIAFIVVGFAFAFRRGNRLTFGDDCGPNPWRATTLEWFETSQAHPAPDALRVHRLPYQFGTSGEDTAGEDQHPQWVQ